MGNELINEDEMVRVELRCGRNMSVQSNYDAEGCGRWEDNTSNQTQATCC